MIEYSNINQDCSEYAWSHFPCCFLAINYWKMSGNPAVVMRLVASAYSVAEKAGAIVRKVLHSGDLGIVEKVCLYLLFKVRSVKRKHVFFSRNEFILSIYVEYIVAPFAQTGANDLQTLADRLAQKSICASLSRRFPKVTIIGEEVTGCPASFRKHALIKLNQHLKMSVNYLITGSSMWGGPGGYDWEWPGRGNPPEDLS